MFNPRPRIQRIPLGDAAICIVDDALQEPRRWVELARAHAGSFVEAPRNAYPGIELPKEAKDVVDTALDEHGHLAQDVEIAEAAKPTAPIAAIVSGSVYESGGRTVTRSLKRTVWPADALVGIRPLADINEKGLSDVIGKTRGLAPALKATVDYMARTVERPEEQIMLLSHSDRPERAEELRTMVEERFHPKELHVVPVCQSCGASIGPSLLLAARRPPPATSARRCRRSSPMPAPRATWFPTPFSRSPSPRLHHRTGRP